MVFNYIDTSITRNKTCSNTLQLTLNSLKKQSSQTVPLRFIALCGDLTLELHMDLLSSEVCCAGVVYGLAAQ